MQVAATKPSLTFFQPDDIRRIQGVNVWTDDDEWDVRRGGARVYPPPTLLLNNSVLLVAVKFPRRRSDIAHRAPSLGRYRPHRALLRKHTRKDRYGSMR